MPPTIDDPEATRTARVSGTDPTLGAAPSAESLGDASAFGRYSILHRIGQGGVGSVFAAYDPQLDRRVAIKVLHGTPNSAVRDRFLREARALARLSHANVVAIHDAAEQDGQLFIAMDFVAGTNLREWARAEARSWKESLERLIAAGRGLHAAHASGLIHRDFKPHNVLVADDGRVLVADFGLARAPENAELMASRKELADGSVLDAVVTQTGAVVGTPAYMAPEQITGDGVDARTDQFSWCVTAWEVLFGVRPFSGKTLSAQLDTISDGAQRPAETDVPDALVTALLKGLSFKSRSRHADMPTLLDAVEPLLDDETPEADRRMWAAAALMVTVVAGTGAFAYLAGESKPDACAADETRLDGVWDDSRRETVGVAVLAAQPAFVPGAWARLVPQLNRYRDRWIAGARTACLAQSQARPEVPASAQTACLDRGRLEFSAFIDIIETGGVEALANADEALAAMVAPSRCSEAEYLRVGGFLNPDTLDPELRDALNEKLARAKAFHTAGKYDEAIARAKEVLAQVELLPDAAFEARALSIMGAAYFGMSDVDRTDAVLSRAYTAARIAGLPKIAIRSARTLVENSSIRHHSAERTDVWAHVARAEASKLGQADEELAVELSIATANEWLGRKVNAEGVMALGQAFFSSSPLKMQPWKEAYTRLLLARVEAGTDLAKASQRALRALEKASLAVGRKHPRLAVFHSAVAKLEGSLGNGEVSLQHHLSAARLLENAYGRTNERVLRALLALASKRVDNGNLEGGLAEMDSAIRVFSSVRVSARLRVEATVRRAETLRDLGRKQDALAGYRDAHDLAEFAFGPTHRFTVNTLVLLGDLSASIGNLGQAKRYIDAATIRGGLAFGSDDPQVAYRHIRAGSYYGSIGDFDRSVEHSREGLRLSERLVRRSPTSERTALLNLCGALSENAPQDALEPCGRALALGSLDALPGALATVLINLGVAHFNLNNIDEAAHYYRLAVTTVEVGRPRPFMAAVLQANLGEVSEVSGDSRTAESYYRRSLAGMDAILPGTNGRVGFPLLGLARTVWGLGDVEQAKSLASRALHLEGKPGFEPVYLADAKALLAEIWLTQGTKTSKARKFAAEALAFYDTFGDIRSDQAAALREFLTTH